MLNKMVSFLRQQEMLQPGDAVFCAVSGGADSMALLWAMYLLREKLELQLAAVHFNHGLRGEESDRDEAFVRDFCQGYQIPFFCGTSQVESGKKGLEAAARDARYRFFQTLPGKIATAHTADDNAETLLMHLVRGTGLKGLGGITPVRGNLIRPMLMVTRQEVLSFLESYSIPFVQDSSNETDAFLRNRLRHHVMPLLLQENPSLVENLSSTALRLRQDEQALAHAAPNTNRISVLRELESSLRYRTLAGLLIQWGVREPEAEHVALLEQLVFSKKPSAKADFPCQVQVRRNYDFLEKVCVTEPFSSVKLNCPGRTEIPSLGIRVLCTKTEDQRIQPNSFSVNASGELYVRSRQPGDKIRMSGGTKSLKELFIDRKIPADDRAKVLIVCDDAGILGVQGIGPNRDRILQPNIQICFESIQNS